MLNAKSLGVEKQIPLNPDMEFKVVDFAEQRGTYFTTNTLNLASYNKYICCMCGGIGMKKCNLTSKVDIILKLPFKPKFGEACVLADVNGSNETRRFIIDAEGNLKPNNNMNFDDGAWLNFHASFPISTGGGS